MHTSYAVGSFTARALLIAGFNMDYSTKLRGAVLLGIRQRQLRANAVLIT